MPDADFAAPTAVIVGQSHTQAVSRAAARLKERAFEIVNINEPAYKDFFPSKRTVDPGFLADMRMSRVISMIGGNFHNTFGLIEYPIRFDFMEPGETGFELAPDRMLITYDLIERYFERHMNDGFLLRIKALHALFDAPMAHVCSPPPIADADYIRDNPGGYFAEKVHLGIAPKALRMRLYRLHTKVVQAFCTREGIAFVPPPPQALDSEGFLAEAYWKPGDPTHSNAAYGKLVLGQLGLLKVKAAV